MTKTVSDKFAVLEDEAPASVDLRNLEAPEPMEKILIACAQLNTGEFFLAHLPHRPNMLFPQLESRGLEWWVHEELDQSALVLIRKKA
jgi:hypothetical protein